MWLANTKCDKRAAPGTSKELTTTDPEVSSEDYNFESGHKPDMTQLYISGSDLL